MMKPLDNFGRRTCMQTVNLYHAGLHHVVPSVWGYHIVGPHASSQHGPRCFIPSIHAGTSNCVNLLCEFAAVSLSVVAHGPLLPQAPLAHRRLPNCAEVSAHLRVSVGLERCD